MRRAIVLVVASVAAAAVAIPALAASTTVTVGDDYFVRDKGVPTVTVKRGTKVTWVWKKGNVAPHNVSATGPKKFASKLQKSGTYVATPHTPGTYTIVCTLHLPGMKMKLVVK